MFQQILIFLLSFTLSFSATPITLKAINSSTITDSQVKNFKTLFMDAFHAVYIEDWDLEFETRTETIFETYISQYRTNPAMHLVAAYKEEQLAGWALFKREDTENAILEILCISTQFWRQGIGRKLVFSICDVYPSINHIGLMTRAINPISPQFYEALGFERTNFSLPEYGDLSNLLGFEWYRKG